MADTESYPGLSIAKGGPKPELQAVYDNPASLFFSFFPRSLWKNITNETNHYERQARQDWALKLIASQERRHAVDHTAVVEDMNTVKARMRLTAVIEAREIARVIGLLIANVLCYRAVGIYQQGATVQSGTIPGGPFGLFMSRNRFNHILRMLHFCNNSNRSQVMSKAWKVRPVVSVLQDTFLKLWELTPELSFDEGVLPSTSRMNTTRM